MPRKRKTAATAAPTPNPAATEGTTFRPLESPSGTELSAKERAEQTTFKPFGKVSNENG